MFTESKCKYLTFARTAIDHIDSTVQDTLGPPHRDRCQNEHCELSLRSIEISQ